MSRPSYIADNSVSLCPQCQVTLRTVDTIHLPEGIKRKRRCPKCKLGFYTMEIPIDYWQERFAQSDFEKAFQNFLRDYVKALPDKKKLKFLQRFYFGENK